ncbi:MAG TPA: hypothetical protein VIQ30_22630 [Pseudonocardia sp.]
MAIDLVESKRNATEDYEPAIIDEFRKESVILDTLMFDDVVNPAGGGATLDYGYRRQTTQPTAGFRAIGSEYTKQRVTTSKHSVTLAVLGGAFELDRVEAKLGPAASGIITHNIAQKVKATRTAFQDAVINGDVAVDANSFDGLDKALTGSSTEFRATQVTDWRDLDAANLANKALDDLDEFLSLLDGTPTLLLGNKAVLAKVRGIARRASQYVKSPIEGLLGPNGRPIVREEYGGVLFADPGDKAGSATPIIPIETRTVGVSTTGLTDLYAYRVALDGFHGVSTVGGQLVQAWLPDFTTSGPVKTGEVELGPTGVALKATKAAAVFRNIRVSGT